MMDLKALAYELLHEAQQSVQEEDHLTPTAIVITPEENLIFEVEYDSEEEREEIYSDLVEIALEKNSTAIVTVNDIYLDNSSGSKVTLEGPGWSSLAESATEAVIITISGRGFETWSLVCPYFRQSNQIMFQPAQEKRDPGGELELLGDWTGHNGAA
ncbi:MAG TPA: hypothetical protein VG649_05795 [Candidatus Angelobacter sp.]|jgi:hypothetical protein|nr:hypothetical protein [Candidatus Angelobacter sp.]